MTVTISVGHAGGEWSHGIVKGRETVVDMDRIWSCVLVWPWSRRTFVNEPDHESAQAMTWNTYSMAHNCECGLSCIEISIVAHFCGRVSCIE